MKTARMAIIDVTLYGAALLPEFMALTAAPDDTRRSPAFSNTLPVPRWCCWPPGQNFKNCGALSKQVDD